MDDVFHCLYFDSLVNDPRVFRYLVEFAGAERVLLGTDYWGPMTAMHQVPTIRVLDYLSDQEKDLILGGNAARLLGLGT